MFKRWSAVLLVLMLAAAVAFAGCAPEEAEPVDPTPDEDPVEEPDEPKRGGTLVVMVEDQPSHLDQITNSARIATTITEPMHATLLTYDEELNLKPYLATDWEAVDDTTFQFNLVENAVFHDGTPVTGEDVKYTIERILDPAVGATQHSELQPIEEVEVVDDHTVLIHLERPLAPLLGLLTATPIVPNGIGDQLETAPVGAGPFKFVEWATDHKLVMERFDDFFIEGLPYLDELVFRFVPEYSAQVSMLETGDGDMHLRIEGVDVPRLQAHDDIRTVAVDLQGFYYLGFNLEREPWDNQKLRQAIAKGVDKERALEYVLEGYGGVADVNLTRDNPYYDEATMSYERDEEWARSVIEEINPDVSDVDIIAPNTPLEGPLGEVLQSQLNDLGLEVGVQKLEVPTFLERTFDSQDFGLMVCGYTAAGDPDSLLYRYIHSEGGTNLWNYDNPRVDELLEDARSTYDFDERKAMYSEVYEILLEEVPQVHMMNTSRFHALRERVQGVVMKPNLRYEFREAWVTDGK